MEKFVFSTMLLPLTISCSSMDYAMTSRVNTRKHNQTSRLSAPRNAPLVFFKIEEAESFFANIDTYAPNKKAKQHQSS
jgi:hypothetical protein